MAKKTNTPKENTPRDTGDKPNVLMDPRVHLIFGLMTISLSIFMGISLVSHLFNGLHDQPIIESIIGSSFKNITTSKVTNCLIIWSYDIKATEIPRIEDEEKFLQIVEGVNNGEITEEKDKELIDYMDETSFKSPRIFLRQGVNHHWDYPDVIKCPGGLSLIEYCKKCDLRYFKRARFISYVINECKIKKNSVSEGL